MEEARGAGRASLVECLLTGVIRNPQSRDRLQVAPPGAPGQRWEFIKENKKVRKQENTLSTKKVIKKKRKKTRSQPRKRSRENDNGPEKKKEDTLSTKKATKRKRKTFFLFFLLSCFLS